MMNTIVRKLLRLCAMSWLVVVSGAAQADKVSLVYVEDAPEPIGSITMQQIETLAASDFTHVVFAFINLCTPPTGTASRPICPGSAPVPVWNIGAAYQNYDGAPFPEVQKATKILTDAGKTLFMSIGAARNAESWSYMASASSADRATAIDKIITFMSDYHFTGVDFDYEAGPSEGFARMAEGLVSSNPNILFSSAPFETDPTASSPISTQWQYCTFQANGVTPTLINRQYYSGGGTADVPQGVEDDLAPFTCSDGTSVSIPPAQMNPGLGIPGQSTPDNCQGPTSCAAIGASVVQAVPDIAGMSLWNYNGLSQPSGPILYACAMANALNGVTDPCVADINAGPIWGNNDAETKCPGVASAYDGTWNGQWTTTVPGEMSVCGVVF